MDVILNVIANILYVAGVISLIVVALFVYFFIKNYRELKKLDRQMNGLGTALKDVKLVYVEQVNNMSYMYDRYTQTFVCQAVTEDELWDMAKKLFPGKEVMLSDNPNLTNDKK